MTKLRNMWVMRGSGVQYAVNIFFSLTEKHALTLVSSFGGGESATHLYLSVLLFVYWCCRFLKTSPKSFYVKKNLSKNLVRHIPFLILTFFSNALITLKKKYF